MVSVAAVTVIARLLTVNVAAVLVAVCVPLQVLVNAARYWFPLSATDGFVTVRVVLVPPGETSVQLTPLVLTCHCTVGAGLPLAVAVKVALFPYVTV